jgi:hypothetical protein
MTNPQDYLARIAYYDGYMEGNTIENPHDVGNPKYGNPDLGRGDINNPNPPLLDQFGKPTGQHLSICEDCKGYYLAYCPCWHRQGGRLNPAPAEPPNKWGQFWRYNK